MTIKNGDLPAMPIEFNGFGLYAPEAHAGLTKREHFAALAMQGILAKSDAPMSYAARDAVMFADELLSELERIK